MLNCKVRFKPALLAWRLTILLLLGIGDVYAQKCTIDSIKVGYSLKNGLDTENVKLLGDDLEFEGCRKLCCKSQIFQYGLHDGSKCFGIHCQGNADPHCTLMEDGNAVFSIFALKREGSSSAQGLNSKNNVNKQDQQNMQYKTKDNKQQQKHVNNAHHSQETSKTLIQQSYNKNNNKHKHKHKHHHSHHHHHHHKKHKKRVTRDFPYDYYNTPLWRLTGPRNNPLSSNTQTLNSPYNARQYITNNLNTYQQQQPNFMNTNQRSFIPQGQWFNFPAFQQRGTVPFLSGSASVPGKPAPVVVNSKKSTVYKPTFDLMASSNAIKPKSNKVIKSFINPKIESPKYDIVKKTNVPLRPNIKKLETPNPDETRKEKDKIMSQINVEPLTEFPTDESPEVRVEKDAIPRPPSPSSVNLAPDSSAGIFEPVHQLAAKDNIYDIPNSHPIEALRGVHSFFPGCLHPVGVSRPSQIPDDRFSATSSMQGFPAHDARLKVAYEDKGGSWCADKNSTDIGIPQYLSIDFGQQTMFCRIGMQGNPLQRKWVERFKLQFSDDGKLWESYREDGDEKIFYGNHDEHDVTFQTLKNPIMARFIRFLPVFWSGDVPCLRIEVFNTTLAKENQEQHSRSDIPKADSTLIEDIGFEKMDETVALDKSNYGNNGFLNGGSQIIDTHSSCRHGVTIPLGGDIVFDGSVMKNHPKTAITIASWVNLNHVEGVHSIFDTVGSHSNHNLGLYHFEVVGGDVRWFHRNETGGEVFSAITGEKVIKPHVWNHLAVTYDSNTGDAIIYINGTENSRAKGHGLLSSDWNNRVGIGRHKGSRFLDGMIDEFKLYDEALQKDSIEELAKKCDFSKYYCGSTLTEKNGSISSPDYPKQFTGPVDCMWNIHGQPGEVIVLDMSQFHLGNKDTCGKANFEVRDGLNDSVIGNYCGSNTVPKIVRSHSNRMYIQYTTDGALPGEMFKVDYHREAKRTTKKTLFDDCRSTRTLNNVTLVGGMRAGKFTQLGTTDDMDLCKQRCCHSGACDAAFLIDENCYAVKCTNKDLCRVRKAKSSGLNPKIAFLSADPDEDLEEPVVEESESSTVPPASPATGESKEKTDASPSSTKAVDSTTEGAANKCSHQPILNNVTLTGGIRSGKFKSHGHVDNMKDCIQYCCDQDECDLAFMVKNTCFSLKCLDDKLCRSKAAKPSPYHPMVAYMTRYKPQKIATETGSTKGEISSSNEESTCKDMRVSKIYNDVTLNGGINSGDFTDKGHVSSIDECVSKCCDTDTCNVAFVIKNTCFLVKCKSYDNCGLKSARSEYYSPKIAYINWNPPKDLDDAVPYTYKGCWRDFDITAFAMPLMEGTDPKLSEPYKKRSDPVSTCSRVAQDRGYRVFAVQNGGACFSGPDGEQTYKRYGKSDGCKSGKGGPFANNVYKTFDDGSVIGLGCWADLKDRAFRRMEKNDPLLRDSVAQRSDPIGACAQVAQKLNVPYFALQKGGQCFVGKSGEIDYQRYLPSRKCKYGLGGQMANDVYMLKKNKTLAALPTSSDKDNRTATAEGKEASGTKLVEELSKPMSSDDEKTASKNATTDTSNSDKLVAFKPGLDKQHQEVSDDSDVENEEHVYKETIADNGDVQKLVYKAAPTLVNVTLRSAINAGKFDDRGKVNSMDDCIKMCGQAGDCDVAFMLSSQCFTVHCFSEESCQNKPAFSDFYNPQLAYVKHRVINRHKNTTFGRTSFPDKPCPVKTELSNVTFIEGINSGNFTDMGHVATFDQCKQKCCENTGCNIAFKIQEDCYGVACHSRESCRTRPAKNANIFSPEMALMRSVHETLEQKLLHERLTFATFLNILMTITFMTGRHNT
uniref:Uncharacterized protein n=1 Tax=Clytia hemisphaerica TaxID=252671 RepID=A0A7M5X7V4_9CNID